MTCRKCGSDAHPYADPDRLCYQCWIALAINEYQESTQNYDKHIAACDDQ